MTVNIISPPKFLIDPVAFFAALVLAPLIVGVIASPIFLISVFAIPFGGLQFLLIGGPILFLTLTHAEPRAGRLALLAFVVNLLVSWPVSVLFTTAGDAVPIFAIFGSIFAPLWAVAFALLYRRFRREIFSQPIH
ncbi:hypothetical protein [Aliiroseovarius sp. YM-037]|uniref:hypothetical protein n=1 Tax=Aliiroseovarius sp. YM-037 TaxID=3341728 RepID=UPI003A7F8A7C